MVSTFKKLSPEKQQAILNAAASVFAEGGYHFGRISKICEKAMISNGALYKYFQNKEGLFLTVVDNCIFLLESELFSKMLPSGESVFKSIEKHLKANVQFSKKYSDYLRIYLDLASPSMEMFATDTSEKIEITAKKYTIKLIEEGKNRGEITKNITNEAAAYLVDSFMTFFAYSLVCEYHAKRFDSFFSVSGKHLTIEKRSQIILEILKQLLT